jgi:hypothetical protein
MLAPAAEAVCMASRWAQRAGEFHMATKCPICGRDDAETIEPGTIDGIVFRCPTPTHGEFAVSDSVLSTLEGNVSREDWESALEKARTRVGRPLITTYDFPASAVVANSEPQASTAPTMVGPRLAGVSALSAESLVVGAPSNFAQRLSGRTTEIRDAARNLADAVNDQIHHMRASKPNDVASLAKHNEFIAFLEKLAEGLSNLADALDEAISAGTTDTPEPVLLGKAGDIARQLGTDVAAWVQENRTNLVDCTMRMGVFLTAFVFLQACGVDGITAAIASFVNASLPARNRDA